MEKFKYNVYLGINNSNDICFAKVEMGEHFSCSFDASSPISVKSLNLNDLADGMIDVVDDSTKLEMCDYYNCSPANLSDSLAESLEDITNLQEFLDCSYYPEILNIGGEDYIF